MWQLLSQRGRARLLLLGSALALGALSSPWHTFAVDPQQVAITATDFSFAPSTITLTVGQPVTLAVTNRGKVDHDLKSDIPLTALTYQQAENPIDEQKENEEKGTLDVDFGPGNTAQVTFTPTKAGNYEFFCDVQNHKELGMQGMFVVQPTAAGVTELPNSGGDPNALLPLWLALAGLALVLAGLAVRTMRASLQP